MPQKTQVLTTSWGVINGQVQDIWLRKIQLLKIPLE
jgi:hypothetical protein